MTRCGVLMVLAGWLLACTGALEDTLVDQLQGLHDKVGALAEDSNRDEAMSTIMEVSETAHGGSLGFTEGVFFIATVENSLGDGVIDDQELSDIRAAVP